MRNKTQNNWKGNLNRVETKKGCLPAAFTYDANALILCVFRANNV